MTASNSIKSLGEVATLYDSLHKTPSYADEGIPMVRVTDIRRGFVNLANTKKVDLTTFQEFTKKYEPTTGDTLFTRVGSYGNSCYVNKPIRFCLGQNTVCIKPDTEQVYPYFLYCCLNSPQIKYQIESFIGGASQPTISLKNIRLLDIPSPSLPTQRKIASILSAYDDLIENNTRRIAILEEMAQAIYREWFVNFRFPGHENVKLVDSPIGKIPEGWDATTVGELCSTIRAGGTPLRKRDDYWSGGTVDWYKTKELWDGYLFDSEEKITELASTDSTTRMFEPNTILMAIYGSPTVGRMGILTRRAACNQAAVALVPNPNKASVPLLFHILYNLRQHFNTIAMGAAQQNISKAKVVNASCILPPFSIVKQFDDNCGPLFSLIRNISLKNHNLRATRDLLLPKLISGQLDVEDLDIDTGLPAEALEEVTA